MSEINKYSDEILISFMEEIRQSVAKISEKVSIQSTNQATLTADLNNHIKNEETVTVIEERIYKKLAIAYTIVGLLVALIIFILGYKTKEVQYEQQPIYSEKYKDNRKAN